jgi:hypothetical protein
MSQRTTLAKKDLQCGQESLVVYIDENGIPGGVYIFMCLCGHEHVFDAGQFGFVEEDIPPNAIIAVKA